MNWGKTAKIATLVAAGAGGYGLYLGEALSGNGPDTVSTLSSDEPSALQVASAKKIEESEQALKKKDEELSAKAEELSELKKQLETSNSQNEETKNKVKEEKGKLEKELAESKKTKEDLEKKNEELTAQLAKHKTDEEGLRRALSLTGDGNKVKDLSSKLKTLENSIATAKGRHETLRGYFVSFIEQMRSSSNSPSNINHYIGDYENLLNQAVLQYPELSVPDVPTFSAATNPIPRKK